MYVKYGQRQSLANINRYKLPLLVKILVVTYNVLQNTFSNVKCKNETDVRGCLRGHLPLLTVLQK